MMAIIWPQIKEAFDKMFLQRFCQLLKSRGERWLCATQERSLVSNLIPKEEKPLSGGWLGGRTGDTAEKSQSSWIGHRNDFHGTLSLHKSTHSLQISCTYPFGMVLCIKTSSPISTCICGLCVWIFLLFISGNGLKAPANQALWRD